MASRIIIIFRGLALSGRIPCAGVKDAGSSPRATKNLFLNALHILQNARRFDFWNTRNSFSGQLIDGPNIACSGPRPFLPRGPFVSNNMKDKAFKASVAGFSRKRPSVPGQKSTMRSLSTSSLECECHVHFLKNLQRIAITVLPTAFHTSK